MEIPWFGSTVVADEGLINPKYIIYPKKEYPDNFFTLNYSFPYSWEDGEMDTKLVRGTNISDPSDIRSFIQRQWYEYKCLLPIVAFPSTQPSGALDYRIFPFLGTLLYTGDKVANLNLTVGRPFQSTRIARITNSGITEPSGRLLDAPSSFIYNISCFTVQRNRDVDEKKIRQLLKWYNWPIPEFNEIVDLPDLPRPELIKFIWKKMAEMVGTAFETYYFLLKVVLERWDLFAYIRQSPDWRLLLDKIQRIIFDIQPETGLKWGLGLEHEQYVVKPGPLIRDFTYRDLKLDRIAPTYELIGAEDIPAPSHPDIGLDGDDSGPFPEFITPISSTITQALDSITELETIYAKYLPPGAIMPRRGTQNIIKPADPDDSPFIGPTKDGSVHLNLTLPYVYKTGADFANFYIQHFYAMLLLQWFEPLLVAVFGKPDPFSYGDDSRTKGSYRLMAVNVVGMSTVTLTMPTGKSIPNDLNIVKQMLGLFEREVDRDQLPTIYSKELDPDMVRRYDWRPRGADFRTQFHKNNRNLLFGFEFRIIDNLRLSELESLLRIIILICDASRGLFTTQAYIASPQNNRGWVQMVNKILHHGFATIITPEEQTMFWNLLQLEIVPSRRLMASTFFDQLVDALWTKFGRHGPYTRYLAPGYIERPATKPIPNELGLYAMIDFFDRDPETGEYRGEIAKVLDYLMSEGKLSTAEICRVLTPKYCTDNTLIIRYLLYHNLVQGADYDEFGIPAQIYLSEE